MTSRSSAPKQTLEVAVKLREILTIAALGMLVGCAYAYMQQADEEAAERERAEWTAKVDK